MKTIYKDGALNYLFWQTKMPRIFSEYEGIDLTTLPQQGWTLLQVGEVFKHGTGPKPGKSWLYNLFQGGVWGLRGPFAHCEIVFVWTHPRHQRALVCSASIVWTSMSWVQTRSWDYYNNWSWEFKWFGYQLSPRQRGAMWDKALACQGKPFNWTGFVLNFTVGRCCRLFVYNARGTQFFCSELTATIKAAALPEFQDVEPCECLPTYNYDLLCENRRHDAYTGPGETGIVVEQIRL